MGPKTLQTFQVNVSGIVKEAAAQSQNAHFPRLLTRRRQPLWHNFAVRRVAVILRIKRHTGMQTRNMRFDSCFALITGQRFVARQIVAFVRCNPPILAPVPEGKRSLLSEWSDRCS